MLSAPPREYNVLKLKQLTNKLHLVNKILDFVIFTAKIKLGCGYLFTRFFCGWKCKRLHFVFEADFNCTLIAEFREILYGFQ